MGASILIIDVAAFVLNMLFYSEKKILSNVLNFILLENKIWNLPMNLIKN